jgi:hypothetical protein
MYQYVQVCTGTRRYKQVQDFAVWYRPVQVGTSQYQISWFWYRTVQISTGFSELVQDGTRQYRSVPDFLYRYRTVQDGTSRYQISGTGTGWYKTVQVGTLFPLVLCVQDCTGQYKSVQDFLNGTYKYILV